MNGGGRGKGDEKDEDRALAQETRLNSSVPCTATASAGQQSSSVAGSVPANADNSSTLSKAEQWAKMAERLLKPIRVHGPDGKLVDGYEKWYGDAREGPPQGVTDKRKMDIWRRFPGPSNDFYPASRDVALNDPRGAFDLGHPRVCPDSQTQDLPFRS